MPASPGPALPADQETSAGAWTWTQSSWGHGLAAQALSFPGPPLRGLWEDDPAMECGRDTLVKGKHQGGFSSPGPQVRRHTWEGHYLLK